MKIPKWLLPFRRRTLRVEAKAVVDEALDEGKFAQWLLSYSFARDLLEPNQIRRLAQDFRTYLYRCIENWK